MTDERRPPKFEVLDSETPVPGSALSFVWERAPHCTVVTLKSAGSHGYVARFALPNAAADALRAVVSNQGSGPTETA